MGAAEVRSASPWEAAGCGVALPPSDVDGQEENVQKRRVTERGLFQSCSVHSTYTLSIFLMCIYNFQHIALWLTHNELNTLKAYNV